MARPFRKLLAAQFKEYVREPEVIFWALLFPVVLAWGLGMAFSGTQRELRMVAVLARAGAPGPFLARVQERQAAPRADGAPRLLLRPAGIETQFRFVSVPAAEAARMLRQGQADLLLHDEAGGPRFEFDPLNATSRLAHLQLQGWFQQENGAPAAPVTVLKVPGTRYIDFLVPGLLALGVMSSSLWGIGWGLVEVRMKKLLKRLAATPVWRSEYLASHLVARLLMSAFEFLLLFGFSRLFFGIRITGSLLALLLLFLAGNLAFSGIAVLTACRTANTRVANGLINAVNLPMMLLSGIFFSYHHFPDWAANIVAKLPLTLLADSLRAVVNEGAGVAPVLLPALALALVGLACFALGLRFFRWH
jgi:ABC-type multidrug transport system permease subunit